MRIQKQNVTNAISVAQMHMLTFQCHLNSVLRLTAVYTVAQLTTFSNLVHVNRNLGSNQNPLTNYSVCLSNVLSDVKTHSG